jgi:hypothetical protein
MPAHAEPGDNGQPCDYSGQGVPPFCSQSVEAPETPSLPLLGYGLGVYGTAVYFNSLRRRKIYIKN